MLILLKMTCVRVIDALVSESVRSVVRFLLVNNHCISDPTAGVTQSMRTLMEWLVEAGHAGHILTTARFESRVAFTIEEHLKERGVALPTSRADRARSKPHGKKGGRADRPVVR